MGTQIKTSVIIPVFNTEKYLPACLESVLVQTQREIEVILVDDGSTDGSLEIERSYAARDPRVRVIEQPNLRQGTARNRGLSVACGEYVYFMDSDDLIVPEHFETCYQICKEKMLDFVTFDSAGFAEDPSEERPELFQEMCDRSQSVPCEVFDGPTFWNRFFNKGMTPFLCWLEYFDRSFLLENDLLFVEGIYFEDNDWIARVFMKAKRLQYLPKKLHRYRDRPGSNVHAGFTHVLADSCFDVHAILCDLARSEKDERRLQILQDVSGVKDIRFRQFAELEPTEKLRERAILSAREMHDGCLDPSLPVEVRIMHLMALLSLAEGVASWPETPMPLSKSLLTKVLLEGLPNAKDAPRIGIYGTGRLCRAFLRVFDAAGRELIFLETTATPGRSFAGRPVKGIDGSATLDLDAVIIASSKFADEMHKNVKRCLGSGMPVFFVPRRILELEGCHALDGLDR